MARVTNARPSERRNTANSKVKLRGQFTIFSEEHDGDGDCDGEGDGDDYAWIVLATVWPNPFMKLTEKAKGVISVSQYQQGNVGTCILNGYIGLYFSTGSITFSSISVYLPGRHLTFALSAQKLSPKAAAAVTRWLLPQEIMFYPTILSFNCKP